MINIKLPLTRDKVKGLKAGDQVFLSGTLYTGRDAAHKRLLELIESDLPLPFELQDQTIYYVGPTPTKPGQVIGVAGPTTSYRMDNFTEALLTRGLKGMIGKGKRSEEIVQAIKSNDAVYFAAIGGAAAKISKCIKSCDVVAFEDLGTEAIRKLTVENLPVIVAIDSNGRDYYENGVKAYLNEVF